jgi:hypothetical protein
MNYILNLNFECASSALESFYFTDMGNIAMQFFKIATALWMYARNKNMILWSDHH